MKKLALLTLAHVAAALAVGSVQAQQCPRAMSDGPVCGRQCSNKCGCGHYGPTDAYFPTWEDAYIDNLRWPRQYVHPARRGICQSFDTMANNGWRRNNLLNKYHFVPEEQEQLSDAGKAKVEWILTQTPPQRRTIFVERTLDAQRNADRIQSVQDLAANTNTPGGPADVQETHIRDEGHPAGAVDAVFTGFSANQLPPMLPQSGGSSSSSSSEQ
jgi:hypothetical protein